MPAKQYTVLTTKDIIKMCFKSNLTGDYAFDPIVSELRPEFSRKLIGKVFDFCFEDGLKLSYEFGKNSVCMSKNSGEYREEYAEVLESSHEGVFLVHHMITSVNPFEGINLIIDLNTNLVSLIYDTIGNYAMTRDVKRNFHFGWIDEKPGTLHYETEEIVHKVIDWKYADNAIIHTAYVNVECVAFTSPPSPVIPGWDGFYPTFVPTRYTHIADDLVLTSMYAPYKSGLEVTMLMDLKKMKAVGCAFGFDACDKFCSYTFGAKGAYAQMGFIGRYTVE